MARSESEAGDAPLSRAALAEEVGLAVGYLEAALGDRTRALLQSELRKLQRAISAQLHSLRADLHAAGLLPAPPSPAPSSGAPSGGCPSSEPPAADSSGEREPPTAPAEGAGEAEGQLPPAAAAADHPRRGDNSSVAAAVESGEEEDPPPPPPPPPLPRTQPVSATSPAQPPAPAPPPAPPPAAAPQRQPKPEAPREEVLPTRDPGGRASGAAQQSDARRGRPEQQPRAQRSYACRPAGAAAPSPAAPPASPSERGGAAPPLPRQGPPPRAPHGSTPLRRDRLGAPSASPPQRARTPPGAAERRHRSWRGEWSPRGPSSPAAQRTPSVPYPTCEAGHRLLQMSSGVGRGCTGFVTHRCDRCAVRGLCAEVWRCATCDYDLCPDCAAAAARPVSGMRYASASAATATTESSEAACELGAGSTGAQQQDEGDHDWGSFGAMQRGVSMSPAESAAAAATAAAAAYDAGSPPLQSAEPPAPPPRGSALLSAPAVYDEL
eukprot:TRINITY_DN33510_c0_g3_i1.p1 TRINITY_DN33510_c0_g3~~TRINITY_DN33510_c0_g3_i1.p1  ORF type:complete len:525 (+),score=105.25 TRINITY_DN33510_c0_g3_i1:96-1577(+)